MSKDKIIESLKTEIEKLRAELEKEKEQRKDLEDTRKAMIYMLEDLNESKSSIEKAKKEWETTFDAITDPLFIHDRELRIMRANRAYAEMAGMLFEEIVGKPYYEIFPKMDGPFKMCLKALELQEVEEVFLPSIDRIFKVRFYPVTDVEGKYLYPVHILEDITEAKRLEERMKKEMEITVNLLMIAEATTNTTDLDYLMKDVLQAGQKIMGCDMCLLYLWDKEDKIFSPAHAVGLSHEMIPLFRTMPLDEKVEFVRKALEWREPVVEQFGAWGSELNPTTWLSDINTMVIVPLIGKTDYLGLLISIYRRPREFTERDRKIMKGINHQVTIALEEARLYKDSVDRTIELSRKIEMIKIMHEIDRSILSILESQEILETAARMIARLIPCDSVIVALIEKQGFIYTAGFGITSVPKGASIPFGDTDATEVIKTRRSKYVANMKEIKELFPLDKRLLDEGFLSHIRVPLIVRGKVIGILNVGSKRPSAFVPEDLSTVEKVATQIGVALENARLISDLKELFIGTIKSLSSAIDAKSPWTRGHSERVTEYAIKIGKEIGLQDKELEDLGIAGLLHDIGKIGISDIILDKPDKLTDDEDEIVKKHPLRSAELLTPIKELRHIITWIKYHHERFNGKGYPDRLKGEEIPLEARILSIADAFDAMRSERPYRKPLKREEIIEEIKRNAGTQFDPKIVEAFLRILD